MISGTADRMGAKQSHHSVNQSHDRNSASALERASSLLQAASLANQSAILHLRSVSAPSHAGSLNTAFPPPPMTYTSIDTALPRQSLACECCRNAVPVWASSQWYGDCVLSGETG